MIDFRRLHYFIVVAQELHFGRAAARLRIAQPPLSQLVKKLEMDLGVQLLERRRGRTVGLTEAGHVLLEEGQEVLRRVEAAAESAKRAARGERGHLRIGFVPSAANVILPLTVRAFRARRPEVTLELNQLLIHEQIDRLASRALDVGFLRPPVDSKRFNSTTVVKEPLVVVLPEGHRLAQRRRIQVAALHDEPFVMEPRWATTTWFDNILSLCRQSGFSPRIVQEAATMQTLLGLVAAGLGVALLPGSIRVLRRTGVVTVPVNSTEVETILVWPKGTVSPALEVFVDSALSVAQMEGLIGEVSITRPPR
jgi:DNA-binding transcriptional LysR family regulator